jgi:hypothetical protein
MYPWTNPFQQHPQQQPEPTLLRAALQQINQGPQQPQQQKDLPQSFKNLYQQWIERNKSSSPMGFPPGPSGDNTNSMQQQASAPPPMNMVPPPGGAGGGPMQQQQMRQQASALPVTPASVGPNYQGLHMYPGMTSGYNNG